MDREKELDEMLESLENCYRRIVFFTTLLGLTVGILIGHYLIPATNQQPQRSTHQETTAHESRYSS